MLKIAICDNDVIFLEELREKIDLICASKKINHDLVYFSSPTEMIKTKNINDRNIIFLDIDMPKMNGFELSKQLLKNCSNPYIIFVTNRDELVYESLRYHPHFFIRKKHLDEELEIQITEVYKLISDLKRNVMFIESNSGTQCIETKEIIYIENNKNYINIHTTNKIITTRKSMNETEKELSKFGFLRVQAGFLVNLQYVDKFNAKEVLLINGIKIQISRSKSSYINEKIKEAILNG